MALLTEPLLTGRGDQVTAVIRNPEHREDVLATGAAAHVGDVEQLSVAELAELIVGHDAVVWSAGAGGGNPERTRAVDRDAAIRAMEAAAYAGVSRFVMVSYFGAGPDHGISPEDSFFAYADAKAAADTHLRSTGLDWTVLGPGTLTHEESSGKIETAGRVSQATSRANVAAVIAATLEEPATVRQTIEFVDGETPIREALLAP